MRFRSVRRLLGVGKPLMPRFFIQEKLDQGASNLGRLAFYCGADLCFLFKSWSKINSGRPVSSTL